jgi:hypothetical protein
MSRRPHGFPQGGGPGPAGEITGMTPNGHILVGWGTAALGFRG